MATLQELMAEVLGETSAKEGIDKQASATKPSTAEVDQVLENLGLQGSEAVVKTASAEGTKNNGGNMSLAEIYEQIMGVSAPEGGQVKTASDPAQANTSTEGSEASTSFGELVGEYFNEVVEPYFEKVAADLETEAGRSEETPLQHATTGGSMTAALGKPAESRLQVNHSASGGAPLRVTTGGHSPYALREAALKKTILKRMAVAPVGNIVD
jgi:hypothetical protein